MATGLLVSTAVGNILSISGQDELAGKYALPTPCDNFTVRELGQHLCGVLVMCEQAALRKSPPTLSSQGDPSWEKFPSFAKTIAEVWSEPEAWTGETEFFGDVHPRRFAGGVTVMELAVHTWDLARALGVEASVDEAVAESALATAREIDEMGGRKFGAFGPELPVGDDASTLERLLAFTGRDVNWTA